MEVAGENKCGEITSQKTRRSWEVNGKEEDIEDWVVSITPWERMKTEGLHTLFQIETMS